MVRSNRFHQSEIGRGRGVGSQSESKRGNGRGLGSGRGGRTGKTGKGGRLLVPCMKSRVAFKAEHRKRDQKWWATLKEERENEMEICQSDSLFSSRLVEAAASKQWGEVRVLADAGVDVNEFDSFGRTALGFSITQGSIEMAEFLLKRGANPNKQDKNGNAPLHLAAISRRMDFVDLLIAAGADPTVKDQLGNTPTRWARSRLELLQQTIQTQKMEGGSPTLSPEVKQEMNNLINHLARCARLQEQKKQEEEEEKKRGGGGEKERVGKRRWLVGGGGEGGKGEQIDLLKKRVGEVGDLEEAEELCDLISSLCL